MKTLQRFSAAFVLTLALALSAFAGEIQTGVTAPPPQATAQGEITTGVTGEIQFPGVTGNIGTGVPATDPTTDLFLSLLHSLLSLF